MARVGDFMYGWEADGTPKPNEHNRKERRKTAKLPTRFTKKHRKQWPKKI
jgi:hypothetical protein